MVFVEVEQYSYKRSVSSSKHNARQTSDIWLESRQVKLCYDQTGTEITPCTENDKPLG